MTTGDMSGRPGTATRPFAVRPSARVRPRWPPALARTENSTAPARLPSGSSTEIPIPGASTTASRTERSPGGISTHQEPTASATTRARQRWPESCGIVNNPERGTGQCGSCSSGRSSHIRKGAAITRAWCKLPNGTPTSSYAETRIRNPPVTADVPRVDLARSAEPGPQPYRTGLPGFLGSRIVPTDTSLDVAVLVGDAPLFERQPMHDQTEAGSAAPCSSSAPRV